MLQPLDTDIPYLEPLLMWLQDDQTLKDHFTQASFFMAHADLVSAVEESMRANCPAPRALWILPGDTQATSQVNGCKSPGRHSFTILIFVQCIRDSFVFRTDGTETHLGGQYVLLSHLRKLVKKSVHKFASKNMTIYNKGWDALNWSRDQNLYPSEENNFLATAIEYSITIDP